MTSRDKILISVTGILCALSLMVMGMVVIRHNQTPPFQPPSFDSTAQTGTPTVAEKYQWAPLEVTDGYTVSLCAQPTVEDDQAVVYFTSPQDNQVWVKLRLLSQAGEILGESGVVRNGEYVERVPLSHPLTQDTPVVMQVVAYTPETWYSGGNVTLNTTLTVVP